MARYERPLAKTKNRPASTKVAHTGSGPAFAHHPIFTLAGVQQDYRDPVATGEYPLMILQPAQRIVTLGGEVTTAEIVVGLQGLYSRNMLFTIDDSGKIVGHAKYSVVDYLALKKAFAQSRPRKYR